MKLSISNYRGIESAEILLEPIALVAGPNGAGKSSIAQAAAAALSGQVIPVEGVLKSEAGFLVRAGTGGGSVTLTREADSATIAWPKATMKTEGAPPCASVYAVGLASIADMPEKERSAALLEYLKATPEKDDLIDALKPLGLSPEQTDKLWQLAQDLGWDGAHKHAKETGIKFKGQWEQITGERYGSSKAEKWIPKNWANDLQGASEESLSAKLTEAREFLEAAIASQAVDSAEMERLRETVAKIPDLKALVESTGAALISADAEAIATAKALEETPPPPEAQKTTPCPHCDKPVVIHAGRLEKPTVDVSEEEAEKIREAHKAAKDAARQAGVAGINAAREKNRAESDLTVALCAESNIREYENREPGPDVEAARQGVRDSEERLEAFRSKMRADKLTASIAVNQSVVAIMAPDGLRQKKLEGALKAFNASLEILCGLASWQAVEVGPDLAISYGRRPWVLLSTSERFRARVVIQVQMAGIDRSQALVIDAADVLDSKGRNGLIGLLHEIGAMALVCMTYSKREEVPALESKGIGRSYWIQEARVK